MPSVHLSAEERRRLSDLSLQEAAGTGLAPPVSGGSPSRSRSRRAWAVVVVAGTVAAFLAAGGATHRLIRPEGLRLVGDFFAAAVHPRVDAQFLALTGNAALTTLAYAVLGTALSLVIGLVGGVLSSQTWWHGRRRRGQLGWASTRVAFVVPRAIHEVVWGLFFLSVLGLQPVVAVLAIGIPFGAVTAKVYSEIIDETARPQYEALIAAGASRPVALLYGLLPPALPDLTSYGFYRLECAIRSAAILGLVGLGGLGYQLQLSFQALQYREIWTLLYALIGLCAIADYWSSRVRSRRTAGAAGAGRDRFITGSIVVAVALLPLSAWWVGLDLGVLWEHRTWQLTGQLLSGSWPPRPGPDGWLGLLDGSAQTLAMSVVAIVVAFLGGLLLAFPAASMAQRRGRRGLVVVRVLLTRAVLIVLRAIPPPIWALMLLFVMFPGILPGAVALGIYTAGVLGRLMAEVAEDLDERPLQALRAHGASEPQVFCYGVLPPAAPRFVAYGLYRWEVAIRETVVVGVVGAGGLGLVLERQLATFDYGGAIGTLLALIVLTLVVDFTSAAIRRSLR
jgi:phosphonate transport system permease protein